MSNLSSSLPTNEAEIISNCSSSSEVKDPIIIPLPNVIIKIPRVPPHYRTKMARDVYDPIIVSLGPYHYERLRSERVDVFKQKSLDAFVSKSSNNNIDKYFYHMKILERITDIRDCYEDTFLGDDETLAWIILQDACFFIHFLSYFIDIEVCRAFVGHFGTGRIYSIYRDLLLLENQIPLWIFKFLLCLQSDSIEEGVSIWTRLFDHGIFKQVLIFFREEPFHLLDALLISHMQLACIYKSEFDEDNFEIITKSSTFAFNPIGGCNFRSITNLNAKGIRLKVNTEGHIWFTSGIFYGELEVPPMNMTTIGFVLIANLLAHENNSENYEFYFTSYINFMKSLVEGPNDVRILGEAGVLVGEIGSADQVFNMFKDLETYNCNNPIIFHYLKDEIETHCRSKAKTWIGELIHIYFRSPWTTIALFAAACLLCLTFLQTFFTILPTKK